MSKFEAHPETFNYRNHYGAKEKVPGEESKWLVLPRDEDGFFRGSYSAVAIFVGPEAEQHAKFHADELNFIHNGPKPEEKPICVHCFQDPAHHAEGCPTIPRTLKCTRCNIIYVGNLLDPCDRCKSTEYLVDSSGNEIRKPETGKRFPRECLDCGAAEGDMHRPGCEAVARGTRQMAELEAQLKDEELDDRLEASYLASTEEPSEEPEGSDEDQLDTED
jgi:hypothetical protein